jgi:ribosomal protein S18 acetylase RimI-like enzyme
MIEPLRNDDDARACAAMMCATDPWLLLGRGFDECLRVVTDDTCETYVAHENGAVRGFIILNMRGAFVGYIRIICVDADARGSGLGSQLVAFAEDASSARRRTSSSASPRSTRAHAPSTSASGTSSSAS